MNQKNGGVLGYIRSQGERFRVEKVPVTHVSDGDYLYTGSTLLRVRSVSHHADCVLIGYWDGRYPWDRRAKTQHVKVAYPDPELADA